MCFSFFKRENNTNNITFQLKHFYHTCSLRQFVQRFKVSEPRRAGGVGGFMWELKMEFDQKWCFFAGFLDLSWPIRLWFWMRLVRIFKQTYWCWIVLWCWVQSHNECSNFGLLFLVHPLHQMHLEAIERFRFVSLFPLKMGQHLCVWYVMFSWSFLTLILVGIFCVRFSCKKWEFETDGNGFLPRPAVKG